MHSCHSPVNSVTGISNVNSISPRKPVVPITLNGLFGDGYGLDDNLATSFSLQSPVNRNISIGKVGAISPSKSLSMELNYNQQPVLLSELADNLPYNVGASGSLPRGSTLCSFISQYDNSRCTNLAISSLVGSKSYCHKHSDLASSYADSKPGQTSSTSTTSVISSPLVTTSRKPLFYSQHIPILSQEQQLNNQQTSWLDNTCSKNKISRNPLVNGMYLGGAQTVFPVSQQAASNIMFPVTYVNPRTQPISQPVEKATNLTPNVVRAVPILAATVINPNGKSKSVQIKQGNVQATNNRSGAVVPMDKDVLQAFVDFLNQNHDRLTLKQQLSLLNSLGVAVATVKNPDDFSAGNHQHDVIKTVHPLASVGATKTIVNQKEIPGNKLNSTTALKRKLPSTKTNSKKLRKDTKSTFNSSLQHLTNKELNEKVQETIASMELTQDLGHASPKVTSKSTKPKIGLKNNSAPITVPSIPIPTVTININKLKNEALFKQNIPCSGLKQYVELEFDQELKHRDLFPLGPFCDDTDLSVCTCHKRAQVLPISPKTKNKTLKQKKSKIRSCAKCSRLRNDSGIIALFKTTLNTTLEMTALTYNHNNASSSSSSNSDDSTFLSSTLLSSCRYIIKSAKMFKKRHKVEKQSIRNLVAAAQSNATNTAAVLKTLGQKTSSRLHLRRRCGTMPSTCALTDRSGNRCSNLSLPLATYCRDHIMHSDHQQLYKLDADMNVIADVYPDPPVIRQRKKTKLPPLSKRKKRRTKKKISADGSNLATKTSRINNNLPTKFEISQPIISDYAVDSIDETMTDVNSVRMPTVSDDPTLSLKTNIFSDNLPASLDDESTSEMFEAFSFDGEELLHDVTPDMFSELTLDNAFLLAGASDSIDKLSFDELNDDQSLCPDGARLRDKQGDETSHHKCETPQNHTPPQESTAPNKAGGSDSSLNQTSSVEHSMWPPVDKNSSVPTNYNDTSTGFGDVSSSLDSSIAEDLNELEHVIESLRDETLRLDVSNHLEYNATSYSSSPGKDSTTNAETNTPNSTGLNSNMDHLQINNSISLPATIPSSSSALPSNNPNCELPVSLTPTIIRSKFNEVAVSGKQLDYAKKPMKKKGSSPSKQTPVAVQSQSIIAGNKAVNGLPSVQISSNSIDAHPQLHPARLKSSHQTSVVNNRVKDGNKPEFVALSQTVSGTTLNPPLRVQPRLIPANVINTAKTNQNMILIPVNAVMRSNNQIVSSANNQNLGIAFAISPQNLGSNVGTMIPIKGSAFLAGGGHNQQVLLLGNNPPSSAPLQTNINFNQLYQVSNSSHQQHTENFKLAATTSSLNQPITIQSQATLSSTSQPSRSYVVQPTNNNAVPLKRKFNRHSIVIPPALPLNNTSITETSLTNTLISPKPTQSRTSVSNSTVHWNQTMGTAPTHQHRPSEGVGGQTSNMLFCRRLNPSLNNKQHVVVGRLGSLGQLGLSRVTVKDSFSKPQSCEQTKSSLSRSFAVKPATVAVNSLRIPDPLLSVKNVSSRATSISPTTPTSITPATHPLTDEKSQLRDLSNQIQLTKFGTSRTADVTTASSVNHVTSMLSAVTSSRHSSRKSDHSQMLDDPDFCESPTKTPLSNVKRTLSQKLSPQTTTLNSASSVTSETSFNSDAAVLSNNKHGRRAAILRKR